MCARLTDAELAAVSDRHPDIPQDDLFATADETPEDDRC